MGVLSTSSVCCVSHRKRTLLTLRMNTSDTENDHVRHWEWSPQTLRMITSVSENVYVRHREWSLQTLRMITSDTENDRVRHWEWSRQTLRMTTSDTENGHVRHWEWLSQTPRTATSRITTAHQGHNPTGRPWWQEMYRGAEQSWLDIVNDWTNSRLSSLLQVVHDRPRWRWLTARITPTTGADVDSTLNPYCSPKLWYPF